MHMLYRTNPVHATPFKGPNMNARNKITVITRDNIRTLKPRTEATMKKLHDDEATISQKKVKNSRERPSFQEAQGSQARLQAAIVNKRKGGTVLIGMEEFDNVKNLSVFLSKEEQEAKQQLHYENRIKALEEAQAKKSRLEEFDHQRTSNEKLSEMEKETREKATYLLTKAKYQLDEQEDEIKKMNELMLYAKCVAIRDIQVEEKKLIQKEKKEEEARLDAMMEAERVQDIKRMEEREKKRADELRKGASRVRLQIDERKEAALLEQEKKDQETKALLKVIQYNNEKEYADKLLKIKAQKKMMVEVARDNLESIARKKQAKLASEEEDRKVLEYIIDKGKKEIENERLQELKKSERELELSRLRAAQEKLSGKQAEQDALRANRAFESYEREWRKKEKDAAEKKMRQEQELKEDRIKQQKARDQAAASEAHKLKVEFNENIKKQKIDDEKSKEFLDKLHKKNKAYTMEIQKQIEEREIVKKKEREEFFLEGIRLEKEAKEKRLKIQEIRERKLAELRSLGLPEKYCKEVERRSESKGLKFTK